MITEVVHKKKRGQQTPAGNEMITPIGVTSWCIGEFTSINDLDCTITGMRPTAQQEYSELLETSTNVTTQDIFKQKDIRDEITSNSDMMSASAHQWDQINGGVTTLNVVIPPIIMGVTEIGYWMMKGNICWKW